MQLGNFPVVCFVRRYYVRGQFRVESNEGDTVASPTELISNPTIFDYAIKNSAAHDSAILEKPAKGNLRPWNSRKKFGLAPEHVTTIGKELLGRK